jgi:hypothetical protein
LVAASPSTLHPEKPRSRPSVKKSEKRLKRNEHENIKKRKTRSRPRLMRVRKPSMMLGKQ